METLAASIEQLRSVLDTNPLAAIADPGPPPGERWTPKQILGHLIDSAANNHQRFVRAQIEPGCAVQDYTTDPWVAAQRYQDRPWEELAALWTAYNRHLLFLMEHVPEQAKSAACRVGAHAPATLEFLMVDYVRHLQHHLRQILTR